MWIRAGVSFGKRFITACSAILNPNARSLSWHRCVKMAVVHDVAEAIVGDITPHCQVNCKLYVGKEVSQHVVLADIFVQGGAQDISLNLEQDRGFLHVHDQVSKEEKKRREEDAIRQMEQMLGKDTAAAREVRELHPRCLPTCMKRHITDA